MAARLLNMQVSAMPGGGRVLPAPSLLPRLASAFAACCCLPLLSAHRIWAIQWLRRLVVIARGSLDACSSSALLKSLQPHKVGTCHSVMFLAFYIKL